MITKFSNALEFSQYWAKPSILTNFARIIQTDWYRFLFGLDQEDSGVNNLLREENLRLRTALEEAKVTWSHSLICRHSTAVVMGFLYLSKLSRRWMPKQYLPFRSVRCHNIKGLNWHIYWNKVAIHRNETLLVQTSWMSTPTGWYFSRKGYQLELFLNDCMQLSLHN